MTEDRYKVHGGVFDNFTNKALQKLITQKHFDGLSNHISVGKESSVFIAKKDEKPVVVKIYRLENCDFNKMYDYIKTDPRFNIKPNKRRVIFMWAQREYKNLLKMREAGVSCPKAITFAHNIVVEEFVGEGMKPAHQLKDYVPEDVGKFFKNLLRQMKKMADNGLVHGDLSHFNILIKDDKPILIDFSQSTTERDKWYDELWKRDIKNVLTFFKKYGIEKTPAEVIKYLKLKLSID